MQPPFNASGPIQPPNHRLQPLPHHCQAPQQQSAPLLDGWADENRPPLPFNVAPPSLTERVRQQAKTRMTRVKVVRKAAVTTGGLHSASLDFDRLSQPLHESGHNASEPLGTKGIASAFQLSWPPPVATALGVGLSNSNLPACTGTPMHAASASKRHMGFILLIVVECVSYPYIIHYPLSTFHLQEFARECPHNGTVEQHLQDYFFAA